MNGAELVRIIDAIRREKNIDAEVVFQGIEAALSSAAKKHFGAVDDVIVSIDRASGDIQAQMDGQSLDPAVLGRIAAQAAKQVIIQKIRDAERASLMEDYADQIGTIISGQVTRIEHGNAVVGLGRGEGFLPRSEQVPGETLHVGDRIRALIIEVREAGANVKIVLSRIHPDLIIRLFELEVPEVADGVIEVEAIAREPGHRTKVAVTSTDTRVDAVGACVGIRGSRIKNIVEEVAGEKIDIVRYNESPQVFIANALKPAEVKEILLNRDINRATVLVAEDQLSLAIGKKGQNVRLAARLSGWNIDILTPGEYDEQRATAIEQLAGVEAVGPDLANDLIAAGYISLADVAEVDPETLSRIAGVDNETARDIIVQVGVLVADLEAHAAEREARKAAEAAAEGEAGAEPAGEDEADAAPAGEDDADAANLDVAPAESDTTEPSPGEPGQAGTHEPQSQEAAAEAAADTPAGTDADAADGTDPEAAPQA
ncbi:MAG: transcription termination/antitermination protein NusA [Planctomycetes bacterium]|nr:transcription termination/antitermination protein NusA [Planctomycetota bacterium]